MKLKMCFKCKQPFGKEVYCQHCKSEFYLVQEVGTYKTQDSNPLIDKDIQITEKRPAILPDIINFIRKIINKIKKICLRTK